MKLKTLSIIIISVKFTFCQVCFQPINSVPINYLPNARVENGRYVAPCPEPANTRIIKVNVHYILNDNGTGNFNETGDGGMNTNSNFNGFSYASYIIDLANKELNNNRKIHVTPWQLSTPSQNVKINYQLNGVFFLRNSNIRNNHPTGVSLPYARMKVYTLTGFEDARHQNAINLYFTSCIPAIEGCGSEHAGNADAVGGTRTVIYGHITKLIKNESNLIATLVNHEIGHIFSMAAEHVMTPCNGPDDGIDDTPILSTFTDLGITNPDCFSLLNNVMNYNGKMNYFSPCQIEAMHDHINGNKLGFQNCRYTSNFLTIPTININAGSVKYNANTLDIPVSSNVIVSNNSALFLNAETVQINNLDVQLGSELHINIAQSCP